MKKLSIVILALLGVVLCDSSAFCWDDLIRMQPGSVIPEQGTMAGTAYIRYSTAGDIYDQDSEKQELADNGTEIRIPLMADYVIMNNLKAFAILPIVIQNKYMTPDGEDLSLIHI